MRHEPLDIHAIDIRSLNPEQRHALKRVMIRRAHAARMAAFGRAFARVRGLAGWLRPAVLTSLVDRVWRAHVRRRNRLQGLAQLSAMTDMELRDIGVSRIEIKAAAWRDDERTAPLPGER